ncbi:MAG: hypothetical protein JWP80_280 [Pseudomonas sp.]|nr:hypothetical protein [Pseudomonas sp.]
MNFFISNGAGSGGAISTMAATKKAATADKPDDSLVRPLNPTTEPDTKTKHLVDLLQGSYKDVVNVKKAASHVEGDRLKNYYISAINKNHPAAGSVIAFDTDAPGTQFSAEV